MVRRLSLIALGLVAGSLFGTTAAQGRPQAPLVIYDDALASGWANWSWDTTINLNNISPVHGGTQSIAVTYTAAWGGCISTPIRLSAPAAMRHCVSSFTAAAQARANCALWPMAMATTSMPVTAVANTWTQIDVPLSTLGSPTTLTDLYWQDTTGGAQPIFYLDDIQLIGSGVPPTPVPPGVGPALSVDAQADQHPISPYIYGMNFADEALAADLNLPVRRWGGNSTSRYNWQINVHNTGSDWYFENIPDDNSGPLPGGSSTNQFVEQDRRTGTKTILTMPLIGWTPKRRLEQSSLRLRLQSEQVWRATSMTDCDPWDTNCGNGVSASGNASPATIPPTRASPSPPPS